MVMDSIRDWLHVYDHCTAIDLIIHEGKMEKYNIGEIMKIKYRCCKNNFKGTWKIRKTYKICE